MPLAQLKPVEFDHDLPTRRPAGADVTAAASPARRLQRQLELHNAAAAEPFVAKWPLGRAVAFVVMSSLALWMALLTVASHLYHAIA